MADLPFATVRSVGSPVACNAGELICERYRFLGRSTALRRCRLRKRFGFFEFDNTTTIICCCCIRGGYEMSPTPCHFWSLGSGICGIVVSSAQPLEPLKRNDANEVGLVPLTRDGAFLDTDQPLDLRLQQSSLGGLPTTTRPSGDFGQ